MGGGREKEMPFSANVYQRTLSTVKSSGFNGVIGSSRGNNTLRKAQVCYSFFT
jgi:hypothetical protein